MRQAEPSHRRPPRRVLRRAPPLHPRDAVRTPPRSVGGARPGRKSLPLAAEARDEELAGARRGGEEGDRAVEAQAHGRVLGRCARRAQGERHGALPEGAVQAQDLLPFPRVRRLRHVRQGAAVGVVHAYLGAAQHRGDRVSGSSGGETGHE